MTMSSFAMYSYSALGAALLWARSTGSKKKIFGFGDVTEKIFPNSDAAQYVVQFIVFVILGSIIGVAVATPGSPIQAITGGVAWSRFIGSD